MIRISVIIPVYNAEKFIGNCLSSIVNQSFKDFEIIAVNDGSVDSSLEILKKHQEKEPRLRVFSQDNKGVSAARNLGLEKSQGKYIVFADADDFFYDKNWLNHLFETSEKYNTEITASSFLVEKDSRIYKEKIPFDIGRYDENKILKFILPYFIKTDNFNAIWSKLYLREFLEKEEIVFPKMPIGEDAYFNIKAFSTAKNVFITDFYGYQYSNNEESATKNILKNDLLDNILNIYNIDFYSLANEKIEKEKINILKDERLVKTVITSIYLYVSNRHLDISQKINKLQKIMSNSIIKKNFSKNYQNFNLNDYEQKIFQFIANKNILKLFLWTYYSYIRNKNK